VINYQLTRSDKPLEISSPQDRQIGARLACFLSDSRARIISEWTAAVHRDRHIISSEALTHAQLTDHVPQLMDDLNDTLCHAFSEDINEHSAWTAATHGHIRWQEGYDLSELLREMGDLRLAILPLLHEFHGRNANASGILLAMTVVHGFLDDSIRTSVEQFIAASGRSVPEPNQIKTGKVLAGKPIFVPRQGSGYTP